MRCRVICSPPGCAGSPSTEPPRVYTSVGPHHRAPSPAELARRTRHRNVTHRVAGRGRTTRHKPHENRQAERLDLSCSLGQGRGTQDRDTNPSPRRSQEKERPSFARHQGPDGRRSVNKAIGALWTPMKARGLCHLRAWRGRLWAGGAAGAGCGRARGARRAPAEPCPPGADGGRAATQCCHPVPREGTAAPRPWLRGARPPAYSHLPPGSSPGPARTRHNSKCRHQTASEAETLWSRPALTGMPAVPEHRVTVPGSYEAVGTRDRAGTVGQFGGSLQS